MVTSSENMASVENMMDFSETHQMYASIINATCTDKVS